MVMAVLGPTPVGESPSRKQTGHNLLGWRKGVLRKRWGELELNRLALWTFQGMRST